MFVRPVLDDFVRASGLGQLCSGSSQKYYVLPVGMASTLDFDDLFDRTSAGDVNRLVGGVFDGPKSYAVFPRHRA